MSANSPTARRWMTPPPIYESSPRSRSETTLKPYLTLPYILSLTWLAYPIISLLFVAFRLQISAASAQDAVSDAKGNLLTSCSAAEKAATAASSLPRYMAIGTNKQIAGAVNDTMDGAREALILALTILESILNFVIDIYRSTFFCFLELVVGGGLSILIGAVQEFNKFLSGTFSSIRTSIQNDVSTANSAISSAIGAINKINPFGDISVPQFSIPSLSELQNVTLPSDIENGLLKLNSSLPTVSDIKNAIQNVVDTPFEALKTDINGTFRGLSFDKSTLPVPDQQTLSFCDQLDTSSVDDLGKDLVKATKIGTIILILLAILLLAAHCTLEWYKWRCLQQHLEYTREAWVTDPTMNNAVQGKEAPSLKMTDHNLLVLSAGSQHPLLTRIANTVSRFLKFTPAQQTNLQWFFHYVFHPPALACFLIGFFGLLSVEMQLIAVKPLEDKYTKQVSASVTDFSNTIVKSINASMYNQSATYANQINGQIGSAQSSINDGLFGWVNGTTSTLNDTLVNFYADIQNAVSTVFNGTVLENPIQDFVKCIIGSKVEDIEKALTFLNQTLNVNLPTVNESVLVLSPADVNEATRPISEAAVGGGSNNSTGIIGTLINRYVDSLKKERLMFAVFIGLWLLVVIIALLIIFWHSYGRYYLEERKRKKYLGGQRDFTSIVIPYKTDVIVSRSPIQNEKDIPTKDLHSFTPAISPKSSGFFNITLNSPSNRTSPKDSDSDRTFPPPPKRTWGGILGSNSNGSTSESSINTPTGELSAKRRPRKLMGIGRKAMGKERFISDEERGRMATGPEEVDDDSEQSGWISRFTSIFRKKDEEASQSHGHSLSSSSNASGSSSVRSNKLNLTIATNLDFSRVARDQLPTAAGDIPARSPLPEPVSAWSISPGPPRALPWLSLNTATKRPTAKGLSLPIRPQSKVRRNVSVPENVDSFYGPSSFRSDLGMPTTPVAAMTNISAPYDKPMPQTPFSVLSPTGVPSYYHVHDHDYGRDSLLPENILAMPRERRRSSSVPLPMFRSEIAALQIPPLPVNVGQTPPTPDPFKTPFDDDAHLSPTQPLNITRSRQASIFGNPFTTPFDDDARVPQQPRTPVNPFSPIAL